MVSAYKGLIILSNLLWTISFIHLWPVALAVNWQRPGILFVSPNCHGVEGYLENAFYVMENMVCDVSVLLLFPPPFFLSSLILFLSSLQTIFCCFYPEYYYEADFYGESFLAP